MSRIVAGAREDRRPRGSGRCRRRRAISAAEHARAISSCAVVRPWREQDDEAEVVGRRVLELVVEHRARSPATRGTGSRGRSASWRLRSARDVRAEHRELAAAGATRSKMLLGHRAHELEVDVAGLPGDAPELRQRSRPSRPPSASRSARRRRRRSGPRSPSRRVVPADRGCARGCSERVVADRRRRAVRSMPPTYAISSSSITIVFSWWQCHLAHAACRRAALIFVALRERVAASCRRRRAAGWKTRHAARPSTSARAPGRARRARRAGCAAIVGCSPRARSKLGREVPAEQTCTCDSAAADRPRPSAGSDVRAVDQHLGAVALARLHRVSRPARALASNACSHPTFRSRRRWWLRTCRSIPPRRRGRPQAPVANAPDAASFERLRQASWNNPAMRFAELARTSAAVAETSARSAKIAAARRLPPQSEAGRDPARRDGPDRQPPAARGRLGLPP